MLRLQDDLLGLYNDLVSLAKITLENKIRKPVKVNYDDEMNCLVFEQEGITICSYVPLYYAKDINKIKDAWILPSDFDYLLGTLNQLLQESVLINERVCISPVKYGFNVYLTKKTTQALKNGPQLVGQVRFCSSNSWLFKQIMKFIY